MITLPSSSSSSSSGRARSSTPSNTQQRASNTPSRPPAPSTPTTPMSMTLPPMIGQNGSLDPASQTKYQQLLSVIEEMSKDIRPCYAGSKSSAERLKRGIVYARILVTINIGIHSYFLCVPSEYCLRFSKKAHDASVVRYFLKQANISSRLLVVTLNQLDISQVRECLVEAERSART